MTYQSLSPFDLLKVELRYPLQYLEDCKNDIAHGLQKISQPAGKFLKERNQRRLQYKQHALIRKQYSHNEIHKTQKKLTGLDLYSLVLLHKKIPTSMPWHDIDTIEIKTISHIPTSNQNIELSGSSTHKSYVQEPNTFNIGSHTITSSFKPSLGHFNDMTAGDICQRDGIDGP